MNRRDFMSMLNAFAAVGIIHPNTEAVGRLLSSPDSSSRLLPDADFFVDGAPAGTIVSAALAQFRTSPHSLPSRTVDLTLFPADWSKLAHLISHGLSFHARIHCGDRHVAGTAFLHTLKHAADSTRIVFSLTGPVTLF